MKNLLLLLLLLLGGLVASTPAARPYVRYAEFKANLQVEASDGSRWAMDAGDCFPIYMFKEHQTKVVLQLGPVTFMVEAAQVKVLADAEAARAQASYEKTLANYQDSQSRKKSAE